MASKRILMTTSLSVSVQVYPYDFTSWAVRALTFRKLPLNTQTIRGVAGVGDVVLQTRD